MRAIAVAATLALACNSAPDDDGCPINAPGFSSVRVTVTEGGSTSFPIYSTPWPPDLYAGFMIGLDFTDASIASWTPGGGAFQQMSPAPIMTVMGLDDGSANASDRIAHVGGAILDCGASTIGVVYVVDRDSLNLNASPWALHLAAGSSATLLLTLTQAPPADVTVAIGSASNASVDPASVMLGSATWNVGVPITVTATATGHGNGLTLDAGSAIASQYVAIDVD
ncbi:MAG TPA: hypothetical protein VGG74_08100 [Kofleriaceae bacterium]|jgi:hypothetical protein